MVWIRIQVIPIVHHLQAKPLSHVHEITTKYADSLWGLKISLVWWGIRLPSATPGQPPALLGELSWEQGPHLKRKSFPSSPCKCWLRAACFGVCEAEEKLRCCYEIFGVAVEGFLSSWTKLVNSLDAENRSKSAM